MPSSFHNLLNYKMSLGFKKKQIYLKKYGKNVFYMVGHLSTSAWL